MPKVKTVYYAHCQTIYRTPQEVRDICLLSDLGFSVCNPADMESEYHEWLDHHDENIRAYVVDPMSFWIHKITDCDVVAFRALPDGRIPAGVSKEIEHAKSIDKLVFELPSNVIGRSIDVKETIEYLEESGQR